jgi:hypothetical protein
LALHKLAKLGLLFLIFGILAIFSFKSKVVSPDEPTDCPESFANQQGYVYCAFGT